MLQLRQRRQCHQFPDRNGGLFLYRSLKHVARKYNIEIQEEEETPEAREARDKRDSLFIVNEFAARWFNEQLLKSDEGRQIGLSYFKERGILESTIETFQLGYAPDAWEALAHAAADRQYKDEYLTDLGLASRSEKTGKLIDRFRGRVIFPIVSPVGKTLGFGGRILGSKKEIAKYINSPESEIYHRARFSTACTRPSSISGMKIDVSSPKDIWIRSCCTRTESEM